MRGGKFHAMMAKGTQAPCAKKIMMTTTTERQSSVDVVVVLTPDDGKSGKVRRRDLSLARSPSPSLARSLAHAHAHSPRHAPLTPPPPARPSTRQILGEFELDGIAPGRAGQAQIEVCFVLNNDQTMRVSANDVQGNRSRALSVKDRVRLG